jgi:tetratricopeptide (TPR) repeat protein
MKLANALARRERFEESIAELDQLLESVPEYEPEILVKRATVLVNLGRGPEALADFRRAVDQRPDDTRLRLRYAEALEYLGDRQGAQAQRTLAEQRRGESSEQAPSLIALASSLTQQGRLEEAVDRYGEALQHDPERVDARFQRALLLGHMQRLEEALTELERIIEQEPRHAAGRRAHIMTLILLQQYGPARVQLNEAMRLFSRDAELAHLQARFLATVPDERVRDGELALQVSMRLAQAVDKPRVRETLAMALAETGEFERAAEIQRDLVKRAEASGDAALAKDFRIKLKAFELERAWWAASPEEILNVTLEPRDVG